MSDSPRVFPGDLSKEENLQRMIRVDHAGEYGAKRIYEGQLAVLGKTEDAVVIQHMADQEQVHLETFEDLVRKHKVRPTALMPLWHAFGFALGAGTALMGREAAMACTVAVESVIDEHYAKQEDQLDDEPELKETIQKFRAEEMEHHDTALLEGAEQAPAYPILTQAIRQFTKHAIWLSERV